jgi:phosphodiesterase/alkaline phosphatase D-like protein
MPSLNLFGLSTTIINQTGVSIWIGVETDDLKLISANTGTIIVKVGRSEDSMEIVERKPIKELDFFGTVVGSSGRAFSSVRVSKKELEYHASYRVEVYINKELQLKGKFRTFPAKTLPEFSFNFVSCTRTENTGDWYKQRGRQNNGFKRMVEQLKGERAPKFCLHLGDNFYPGSSDGERYERWMWTTAYMLRSMSGIKGAFANIPFFHTWDNHDHIHSSPFGGDNRERSERRRKTFSKVYKVPSPTKNPDGIYYAFNYSRCGFFILDTRSQRKKDKTQLLGKKQWEWLEAGMHNDNYINFICTSSPLHNYTDPEQEDPQERRWQPYEGDYNRLHRLLAKHKNIIVLTGDIHRCKVSFKSFEPRAKAKIAHEAGTSDLPKTQCALLYSSGIGERKLREHKEDSIWEQSYLTLQVKPAQREVSVRRVGHSALDYARSYPYEESLYPKLIVLDPAKESKNYMIKED